MSVDVPTRAEPERIAELVRTEPATVGYHLVIARRRDPELEAAHLAAAATGLSVSLAALARMEQIVVWVEANGRLPRDRSEDKGERSMARWLSDRRREAAQSGLHATYGAGLTQVPGWRRNPRAESEEARWDERLAQLVDFREEGNNWPRHKSAILSGNALSACGCMPSGKSTVAASSPPGRARFELVTDALNNAAAI